LGYIPINKNDRSNIKKYIKHAFVLFMFIAGLFIAHPVYAQLSINLVAVNATDQVKKVPVKYYLPEELEPEDLIDLGVLKLDYNVDKGAYFVSGEFEFQPKESRTFKVSVKDVWKITENEINILKAQLEDNLMLMKDNPDYDKIVLVKDSLDGQLDFILSQQVSYSDNIERRIEEYRAYKEILEEIRKKAFTIEQLQYQAKSYEEMQAMSTVKFLIEVRNPSDKEEKNVSHKHYLPKEVRAKHVIEKKGFEVRYDNKKAKAYLSKEEVFQPAETKKYEIVLKDIWMLPTGEIKTMLERAEKAMEEIEPTAYSQSGKYLFDMIKTSIDQINASQVKQKSIKEHIGIFRVNKKRYKRAEEDIIKLEQMLAIVRAKKLEKMEKGKVRNVLQKMKALKGLAALSEAVFKKKISRTMTWKIIIATLMFLAIFTAWHFIVWTKRSNVQGEELGLAGGEAMKVVPKPGEEEKPEEEQA